MLAVNLPVHAFARRTSPRAAVATIACLLACSRLPGGRAEVGTQAPNIEAQVLIPTGGTRSLASYRGHIVLLNVWATWCQPCREELPALELLHREFAARGLSVVAISIDAPGMEAAVRRFAADHRLTFDILYDPSGSAVSILGARGIPVSVLIDRAGVIRGRFYARDWATQESHRLVSALLG